MAAKKSKEDVQASLPPSRLPAGQLDALASTLRRLYVAQMSAIRKRPYKMPERDNAMEKWRRVAEMCAGSQADPTEFMQAIFESSSDDGVWVSQVASGYAITAYQRYKAQREMAVAAVPEATTDAEAELILMLQMANQKLMALAGSINPLDEKVRTFLRLEMTALPSYIRCLLCAGDPDVLNAWAKDAQVYFLNRPALQNEAAKLNLPVQQVMSWRS